MKQNEVNEGLVNTQKFFRGKERMKKKKKRKKERATEKWMH